MRDIINFVSMAVTGNLLRPLSLELFGLTINEKYNLSFNRKYLIVYNDLLDN